MDEEEESMYGERDADDKIREILSSISVDPARGVVVVSGFDDPRMKASSVEHDYDDVEHLRRDLEEIAEDILVSRAPFEGGQSLYPIDGSSIVWNAMADYDVDKFFESMQHAEDPDDESEDESDDESDDEGEGSNALRDGALAVRVLPNGRVVLGVVGADGTWQYLDGSTRTPCGIYKIVTASWSGILHELEDMLNDPHCSEPDLQRFLERNPELLAAHRFSDIIPQAQIVRDDAPESTPWRADFVLSPVDQADFCRILELKRPQIPTVLGPRAGHPRFAAELHGAVQQLKDYDQSFKAKRTQDAFRARYGVTVAHPELHLIIGRRWSPTLNESMRRFQREHQITVSSWDVELSRFRRLFL